MFLFLFVAIVLGGSYFAYNKYFANLMPNKLDIMLFRNYPEKLRIALRQKGEHTTIVDDIIKLDFEWRILFTKHKTTRSIHNLVHRIYMHKLKNKYDIEDIKKMLLKLDIDAEIINYDFAQLQKYQKNNNLQIKDEEQKLGKMENEIIEKLNKVGNIIYNCDNYDARVSKKRFCRPY